jgi:hypothetical protein
MKQLKNTAKELLRKRQELIAAHDAMGAVITELETSLGILSGAAELVGALEVSEMIEGALTYEELEVVPWDATEVLEAPAQEDPVPATNGRRRSGITAAVEAVVNRSRKPISKLAIVEDESIRALGLNVTRVENILYRLDTTGRIEKVSPGVYRKVKK